MGVAAGIRALLDYLASEPAHAHLTIVDTFAASPLAIEIRDTGLHAFAAYLQPGYHYAPPGTRSRRSRPRRSPAASGRCCTTTSSTSASRASPSSAPQLVYVALAPFIGAKEAARIARKRPAAVAPA